MDILPLVEDHPDLRELFQRLVARLGYTVRTAASTPAMQQLLQHHHPHLILLDYHLGQEAPGNALMTLRNDPQTAAISVVVLTGDPQASWTLQDAGVPTLLKPVMVATLDALLLRLVGPAVEPRQAVAPSRAA